jgi:hypothetical protein
VLFKPDELAPGYTPEGIEKLFFLKKDLSDLSDQEKDILLTKVNSLGLKDIRLDTVQLLLCVMHEARERDQPQFLKKAFLPGQELRQKTRSHFERISEELVRIGEFEPGSVQEAAHAANVYRNIVSDLFDPYLTLIVASFQFKEGTFTNLDDADLGHPVARLHAVAGCNFLAGIVAGDDRNDGADERYDDERSDAGNQADNRHRIALRPGRGHLRRDIRRLRRRILPLGRILGLRGVLGRGIASLALRVIWILHFR